MDEQLLKMAGVGIEYSQNVLKNSPNLRVNLTRVCSNLALRVLRLVGYGLQVGRLEDLLNNGISYPTNRGIQKTSTHNGTYTNNQSIYIFFSIILESHLAIICRPKNLWTLGTRLYLHIQYHFSMVNFDVIMCL